MLQNDLQRSKVIHLRPRSVHSDEYKLVASLLLEARQKSGLTQRDVAARLGKPAAFPHKVEHGEREINIVELLDYCDALKLDFSQFAATVASAVKELRQQNVDPESKSSPSSSDIKPE